MFKLETKSLKKGNRIMLSGELTIYSANSILEQLDKNFLREKDLLLDLSKVSEIDTAGIQLLLVLNNHIKEKQNSFIIEKSSTCIDNAMTQLNLFKFIDNEVKDE